MTRRRYGAEDVGERGYDRGKTKSEETEERDGSRREGGKGRREGEERESQSEER